MRKPTPKQVDALKRRIDHYDEAAKPSAKQIVARDLAAAARARALGWALQFGEAPASAPASKRIAGVEWQFTAIGGLLTQEHPEAVTELRDAMRKHKHDGLFSQMFVPVTHYERAKAAAVNFAAAALPEKLRTRFAEIFARTQTGSPRKPSLRIDPAAK